MPNIYSKFRTRVQKTRKRGGALLEVIMAMAIFSLLLVFLNSLTQTEYERIESKATADKLLTIGEGAKSYMTANYATLLATAPLTGNGALVIPVGRTTANGAIPADSIQAAGFLPANFIDVNAFQKNSALLVRRINARTLEAMLTTYGGREIPDDRLGTIARFIGPAGGYVPERYVSAADNGNVLGLNGGWRTLSAEWGPADTRPSSGDVQMTMMFEDGELLKDYLYRNDIGVEEANRMNTNIDMNSNSLNNTDSITGIDNPARGGKTVTVGLAGDTSSLDVTRDIFAGQDLSVERDADIGGNARVTGNMTAGSINSNSYVAAATDVVAGQDVQAGRDLSAGRNLAVADNSTLGDCLPTDTTCTDETRVRGKLYANEISIDAKVFGNDVEGGSRVLGVSDVTLGDLLPRMVTQYSYLVQPGQLVAKPTCRGGYGRARVMVYKQVDSSQSTPNINLTVQNGTANGATFVGGVAYNPSGSWVRISQGIVAIDNGTTWTVNWVGDPAAPNTTRQALAQTFCYYGKA